MKTTRRLHDAGQSVESDHRSLTPLERALRTVLTWMMLHANASGNAT